MVLITIQGTNGVIYETSSKKVNFTVDYIDQNGSSEYCVQLLEGFDTTYSNACFTRLLNERGVFLGCNLTFDGEECNSCGACSINDAVGLTIDCYNLQPMKNIMLCEAFSNSSVQEALVDKYFDSVPFDFALNVSQTGDSGNGSGSSGAIMTFTRKLSVGILAVMVATLLQLK